jgi:glycyl-tRNA synthetase beta chain
MHYALASGEDSAVAVGIWEHYLPKGQNDELPQTITGAVVALADKMDTVCGIIGAGMLPTGSADPFALRRAANGVVQIIAEHKYELDLTDIIRYSLDVFGSILPDRLDTEEKVGKFYHQRVTWLLQQYDIEYDVTDSVMHIEYGKLIHLLERAISLQSFKSNADFVRLVVGFKRVSNIIKDVKAIKAVDVETFIESAESELYAALLSLEQSIAVDLQLMNYTAVLEHLVSIRAAIDRFFDEVLVNTDDELVKQNRFALLSAIRSAFLQVADLSLIVVEGDKK